MRLSSAKIALALTVAAAVLAPAAQAVPVSIRNAPILVSDGVVVRANVFLPNDTDRFPVVLTTTGYNKDVGNPTGTDCSAGPQAGLAASNTKLLDHGIAVMILDDRGTGASEGRWDS